MTQVIQTLETKRREPLFRDPLAAKLAGDHGKLAALPRTFLGAWSVVIRTIIIDDLIKQAIVESIRLSILAPASTCDPTGWICQKRFAGSRLITPK